jgi:hypothetical protein
MQNFMDAAFIVALALGGLIAAGALALAAKHRKKWMPPLEDLVTLDSRGWFFIASISTAGAFVMIATSQLFSASYWLGLAVDSDGNEVPAALFPLGDWLALISVTTISALALSLIFELVSDIGAPTASGLKKEKKKGTPEVLLIATACAIFMSLVSKWGYYEDKRQARALEAAQISATDATAQARLDEANAEIARLAGTPSAAIAKETEDAAARQIVDLSAEREAARTAREAIPENQGSNRLAFQRTIDDLTTRISALEEKKIEAAKIREDAQALADAKTARDKAQAQLDADAGKLTADKKEFVKAGDLIFVRVIRSGLHQVLCFLFPIIALDAWTTARKVRTREEAGRKGADTRKRNNPNAVYDAEFEPPSGDVKPFGGYLGADPPAAGEAPEAAQDARGGPGGPGEDLEGEEGEGDAKR